METLQRIHVKAWFVMIMVANVTAGRYTGIKMQITMATVMELLKRNVPSQQDITGI
jgi:hypothetical protein